MAIFLKFECAMTDPLANGLRVYAAKPDFRREPIKVFRDALNQIEAA